jgi:hypothetical protein
MTGSSQYGSLHGEIGDVTETRSCKLEKDYFWSLWKRKRAGKHKEKREEKRRLEEDFCWSLWKQKRKEKRGEKCLPRTRAKTILDRARLKSWEGHVKVNAVFRDPLTGKLIAGRLTWKEQGDVTTHPIKLLNAKCPQEVTTRVLTL